MAMLTITEVEKIGQTLIDGQFVMAPQMPPVKEQDGIVIGVGSVASAAFQKATRFVIVNGNAAYCLAWSDPENGNADPTAVNTQHQLGAGETRFYSVRPG